MCPVWVQGTLRGKPLRKSLDVRSWEAGQRIVRDWEAGGNTEVPTIDEAARRLVADMRSRGLSEDTNAKFEILKSELCARFSGISVSSITSDDLASYRETWKVRPSTARKKLERLRSFFKFCVDRDWMAKNPASALKYPKETPIEKKPYEKDELERIDWAIPLFPAKGIYGDGNRERIKAFVLVLRWTGLRIRDAVQLKRSSVRDGRIFLRTHKNQKPIKLVLHPSVKVALQKVENPGDYFFWSGVGNVKSCIGDWQRTLRRLGKIAGVHVHAHRWRHTFATDLLSKGVPVSEVAAILGNSTRIVEKHYAQWIESRQTALEEAVKKAWK